MKDGNRMDFGYSWVWTYGHLLPAGLFMSSAIAAVTLSAPIWSVIACSLLALWFFAGFCVSRFVFRMNALGPLPTSKYLSKDSGRVLDIGCGAGRTSIMLGQARRGVEIVALDNFSANYIAGHGEGKTVRNFEIAGIEARAAIQESDMRSLPFEAGSFDGAISCAAIDHLDGDDIPVVLSEVRRVLQLDGEFLLMVIVPNFWTILAYGPLVLSAFRRRAYWRESLRRAGFLSVEEGTTRGCAWFLVRRSAAEVAAATPNPLNLGRARKGHSLTFSGMFLPVALTGIVLVVMAAAIEWFELNISWWWLAAVVPIAMHFGLILMMAAGVLKWLSRTRA